MNKLAHHLFHLSLCQYLDCKVTHTRHIFSTNITHICIYVHFHENIWCRSNPTTNMFFLFFPYCFRPYPSRTTTEMRVRNIWICRKDIKIPETADLVEFCDNTSNDNVLWERKHSTTKRKRNTACITTTAIKLLSLSWNNRTPFLWWFSYFLYQLIFNMAFQLLFWIVFR